VLAGRFSLSSATQRAPRHPNLSVVTTGGTASAGGLLQSQSLRDTLALLRERAAYVVIEAPSTATSADAQSLASLADAAILAVELRRTSNEEVLDAADQLRRVGTPLLGAVVLPRLAAARTDEEFAEPGVSNDVTAILEAIADSGASNDETIVTKRIKTTHHPMGASNAPSAPPVRKRPKLIKPADRPIPTEFSIRVARTEPPPQQPSPQQPSPQQPSPQQPSPQQPPPQQPQPQAPQPTPQTDGEKKVVEKTVVERLMAERQDKT
jgi:hypothetical protein